MGQVTGTSTVSEKGQLVIPREVRKALGRAAR
ncbi:AbrB/MazE/SpoVT family DNA-binding domain-containing protein [Nitrococcus mobilis]|nr:AbrB/MazE/SpoVT family DNA-binding domain-containing protein [Nitrococcus mobilis]